MAASPWLSTPPASAPQHPAPLLGGTNKCPESGLWTPVWFEASSPIAGGFQRGPTRPELWLLSSYLQLSRADNRLEGSGRMDLPCQAHHCEYRGSRYHHGLSACPTLVGQQPPWFTRSAGGATLQTTWIQSKVFRQEPKSQITNFQRPLEEDLNLTKQVLMQGWAGVDPLLHALCPAGPLVGEARTLDGHRVVCLSFIVLHCFYFYTLSVF